MSREMEPLLCMDRIAKSYQVKGGMLKKKTLRALDGVSLSIREGETLGLVGESGSGKSTAARVILGLVEPDAGRVLYRGEQISGLSFRARRPYRKKLQMVFQDPCSSLDPKCTIRSTLMEPLESFFKLTRGETERRMAEMLEQVGLDAGYLRRYPHELSGGQRQRVAIARALLAEPELVAADEAVSALDVSVQAQVLNVLTELQRRRSFACLFISHDMEVVEHVADRVAVMYLGSIVETAPAATIFRRPRHPYTQVLLSAAPPAHPDERRERNALVGEIPDPADPPAGCPFHPRCPACREICRREKPAVRRTADGAEVRCHLET